MSYVNFPPHAKCNICGNADYEPCQAPCYTCPHKVHKTCNICRYPSKKDDICVIVPKPSLLEAVATLYNHNDKKTALIYKITFYNTPRCIKFGKQYNHAHSQWDYFIHESFAPCLTSTEANFIGHLANTHGVAFGSNMPDYTVTKI